MQQATATRDVDLGTDTPGRLGLTDAELDLVTASLLRIGRTDTTGTGRFRVTSPITGSASYDDTLSLRSGATDIVTFGTGSLNVTNLAVVGNTVGLRGTVTNLVGRATSTGDGSSFFFDSSADLTVSGTAIDGIVGITTTGNNQILLSGSVSGTALTVDGALATGAGIFGDITLWFDNIAINAAISAGTSATPAQRVEFRPWTAGQFIALGGPDDTDTLGLTDLELDLITTGVLQIGYSLNVGGIIVTDPITAPAGYNTLSLVTLGAITEFNGSGQPEITVANLALRTGTGIGDARALDVAVTNLAFSNSTSGAVNIANAGALTIAFLEGLNQSFNGGTSTTIATASPLTFAVDTTTTGDTTYTAGEIDDDPACADDLTINPGVTVSVTASDLTLRRATTSSLARWPPPPPRRS